MRTGAKPTRPITSLLLAFMVLHVFNAANVRLGVPRIACLSGRNRSAPIVKAQLLMHYTGNSLQLFNTGQERFNEETARFMDGGERLHRGHAGHGAGAGSGCDLWEEVRNGTDDGCDQA